MTLLTICQCVADHAGVPRPSSIIGNNDINARRLLQAAQQAGKYIAQGMIYSPNTGRITSVHSWSDLCTEYTFTTDGSSSYSKPSDFKRFVGNTWWNRTGTRKLSLVTPQDWQRFKGTNTIAAGVEYYMIERGGSILIYPTEPSGSTFAYEYVSANWCQSSGGTGQSAWAADDDVGVIDEDLIEKEARWRFLQMRGDNYAEEKQDAYEAITVVMSQDGGRTSLSIYPPDDIDMIQGNFPETGYGA